MIAEILIFLAWGSYLNSLGYRLLNLEYFLKIRSFCPNCHYQIAWYDNIPIFSWINLKAKCRLCQKPISLLYPCIEIITTASLFLLWQTTIPNYFAAYFLFFSALIVTLRTDCDQMLISRFATLYLIPVGLTAAFFNKLPISFQYACLGACFGYFVLWSTKKISYIILQQESLGQGDLELLALIGAFTGPYGAWITLTIGSIIGTIITLILMIITKEKIEKIPLGAYLSFAAILYTLFQNYFIA